VCNNDGAAPNLYLSSCRSRRRRSRGRRQATNTYLFLAHDLVSSDLLIDLMRWDEPP
jgi:hypothetical protein